jgi:hypothetical protein
VKVTGLIPGHGDRACDRLRAPRGQTVTLVRSRTSADNCRRLRAPTDTASAPSMPPCPAQSARCRSTHRVRGVLAAPSAAAVRGMGERARRALRDP